MSNVRAIAARIIEQVIDKGQSLNDKQFNCSETDRAMLQALCYGTLRHFYQLELALQTLLEKPLAQKNISVKYLLLIGLYQLHFMRIKPHAILNETVQACVQLKKPWAKQLVNGVLRNQLRKIEANTNNESITMLPAHSNHPKWLIEIFEKDWGNQLKSITSANNQQAPMTLRINLARTKNAHFQQSLTNNQIEAIPIHGVESALSLAVAMPVQKIPGFKEGFFSVQDAAGQLVPELLQLEPKQVVLDACAAPGSKTCHLLEKEPDIQLTALDCDAQRLSKLQENCARLKLQCQAFTADASLPQQWPSSIPKQFDRILLDAPCSGTGVIRRHPDIKFLRKQQDIPTLASKQLKLLHALWPQLKPNGLLLYTTCSIFKEENQDVIKKFLQTTSSVMVEKISLPAGSAQEYGWQILPQYPDWDGFYYCLLKKSD